MKTVKYICSILFLCAMSISAFASELKSSATIRMTSDTAANAKNIAMDEARRQIITDVLQPYCDKDALGAAMQTVKNADLVPVIAGVSIEGEQASDTVYAAKFTMTVDSDAARLWLGQNNIQNWLPDNSEQDVFMVRATLVDNLSDWGALNQIARNEKLNMLTKNITNNIVVFALPRSGRGAFTIALREQGWKYSDSDGVLNIWK
jgi:hypothetical protein